MEYVCCLLLLSALTMRTMSSIPSPASPWAPRTRTQDPNHLKFAVRLKMAGNWSNTTFRCNMAHIIERGRMSLSGERNVLEIGGQGGTILKRRGKTGKTTRAGLGKSTSSDDRYDERTSSDSQDIPETGGQGGTTLQTQVETGKTTRAGLRKLEPLEIASPNKSSVAPSVTTEDAKLATGILSAVHQKTDKTQAVEQRSKLKTQPESATTTKKAKVCPCTFPSGANVSKGQFMLFTKKHQKSRNTRDIFLLSKEKLHVISTGIRYSKGEFHFDFHECKLYVLAPKSMITSQCFNDEQTQTVIRGSFITAMAVDQWRDQLYSVWDYIGMTNNRMKISTKLGKTLGLIAVSKCTLLGSLSIFANGRLSWVVQVNIHYELMSTYFQKEANMTKPHVSASAPFKPIEKPVQFCLTNEADVLFAVSNTSVRRIHIQQKSHDALPKLPGTLGGCYVTNGGVAVRYGHPRKVFVQFASFDGRIGPNYTIVSPVGRMWFP